jgi:DNA-binding MarR family transcriptional regulator
MSSLKTSSETRRTEQIDYVAGHLLTRAALLVRLLVRQVGDSSIPRTEGEVLSILTAGPRRVTDLAELGGVAQPTMTLLVKRLEERGWVEREGLPADGRVVMVRITGAGSAALETFRAHFVAALRADVGDLSDQHLAALMSATQTLESFVDALQQRVGK